MVYKPIFCKFCV
uniref:Uncharacterized protein n=1 Tax=Anguilla anguilla TaxID=7936 RepID=A0A0E9UW59_ANGAN